MIKINYEFLLEDSQELHNEYVYEGRKKYEELYDRSFIEKEKNNIISIWLETKSNYSFQIEVDRAHSPIKTYFFFEYDISNIKMELRNDPVIRLYTKLCFYIEENVGFYSSVLDSNKNTDI
ncbi:MAG: hypothetical protein J5848_01935 [Bacteroidales bacterium]|nr:hypothetical protein [Bacteroidales bacterium]